jgi:hypothetical protein
MKAEATSADMEQALCRCEASTEWEGPNELKSTAANRSWCRPSSVGLFVRRLNRVDATQALNLSAGTGGEVSSATYSNHGNHAEPLRSPSIRRP